MEFYRFPTVIEEPPTGDVAELLARNGRRCFSVLAHPAYDDLKDARFAICVAGGNGHTAFMALAKPTESPHRLQGWRVLSWDEPLGSEIELNVVAIWE